jgi:hypothetical protein
VYIYICTVMKLCKLLHKMQFAPFVSRSTRNASLEEKNGVHLKPKGTEDELGILFPVINSSLCEPLRSINMVVFSLQ